MSGKMYLKYITVTDKNNELITSECPFTEDQAKIISEGKKIISKSTGWDLRPNERKKVGSKRGNWFIQVDEKHGWHFSVLAEESCPERLAHAFLQKLIGSCEDIGDGDLEAVERVVKDTTREYENKVSGDHLVSANSKVDLAKEKAADAIKQAIVFFSEMILF